MIRVDVANEQTRLKLDRKRLRAAIEEVLRAEGYSRATISLAIVDDATIQSLNRRWLNHDYPTDVLSFVLQRGTDDLDGEIIASGDTAAASAARFGWSANDELLLYVIHGALHLVGYDDREPTDQQRMRQREREYLGRFGLRPRSEEEVAAPPQRTRRAAGKPAEGLRS